MGRGFWGHRLPKIQELSAQSLLGPGAGKTSHWAGCFWLRCVWAALTLPEAPEINRTIKVLASKVGAGGSWSRFPELSNGVILLSKPFESVDRAKK